MQLRKRIEELVSRHGRLAPFTSKMGHTLVNASHPLNWYLFFFCVFAQLNFYLHFPPANWLGKQVFFKLHSKVTISHLWKKGNFIFTITLGLWWVSGYTYWLPPRHSSRCTPLRLPMGAPLRIKSRQPWLKLWQLLARLQGFPIQTWSNLHIDDLHQIIYNITFQTKARQQKKPRTM